MPLIRTWSWARPEAKTCFRTFLFNSSSKKSSHCYGRRQQEDNFVELLRVSYRPKPCIKLSHTSSGSLIKVISIELHFTGRCNFHVAVCPKYIHLQGGEKHIKWTKCHWGAGHNVWHNVCEYGSLKSSFVHAGASGDSGAPPLQRAALPVLGKSKRPPQPEWTGSGNSWLGFKEKNFPEKRVQ